MLWICVGRTLLSVAFDFSFPALECKVKGDGQECPSYTKEEHLNGRSPIAEARSQDVTRTAAES